MLAKPLYQGVQAAVCSPLLAADVGRRAVSPTSRATASAPRTAAVARLQRSAAGGHIFRRVQKDLKEEKQIVFLLELS